MGRGDLMEKHLLQCAAQPGEQQGHKREAAPTVLFDDPNGVKLTLASFSGKLSELDGVKSVTVLKRGRNDNAS